LWELPQKYHCPVIGTCVTVDDLRRLAQKAGCRPKHALGDYEVHVSFVGAADNKNALSLALQRLLERRHAAAVRRFARADTAEDLARLWRQAVANGEVQGALWAVMTHPRASAELRALAYEDVHMLSHQIGAGLSADLKALAETRETLARVRREAAAEADRAARRLGERDARIRALEQRVEVLADSERKLAETGARLAELESGTELTALRGRVAALEAELAGRERREREAAREMAALRRRADATAVERETLAAALAEREHSVAVLERLLAEGVAEARCGCDGDCAHCTGPDAAVDLRGRRILCVGGRGSLNAHYRDLVQRCNGELIRHDGGLEDSRQRLEALLARADAVVCPADCVSHDAYLRTKRYCKRLAKPCVLIDRSGIGAFAAALSQLAAATSATDGQVLRPA
jgi:hypothetical protein